MLDTSENAIARRLREAMDAANISNTQLAEAAEVTVQAVGDWLRTGKIARERLPAVCACIRRSSDWLLTGDALLDEAVDYLPDEQRQQVFDFILYKIEKASPPHLNDRVANDYVQMIERLKADMANRKKK